jgi:diketogulonate reductase-like aldo/keto reductase
MVRPEEPKMVETYCTGPIDCVELNNGVHMPRINYGTYGSSFGWGEYKSKALLGSQQWISLGGRGIDTAQLYEDQDAVGAAVRSMKSFEFPKGHYAGGLNRDDFFIETKCSGAIGYYAIIECMQDNLVILGMDYVDLLLIRARGWPRLISNSLSCARAWALSPFELEPGTLLRCTALSVFSLSPSATAATTTRTPNCPADFPTVPRPECILGMPECSDGPARVDATREQLLDSWRAMELIYKSGKARAIGLSDYPLETLKSTVENAKVMPAVLQVLWNPLLHDEPLLAYCREKGIQLQAFGSVGGLLNWNTHKYDYVNVLGNSRVRKIAEAHHVTPAEVALAWTLQKGVTIALGTASPEHMKTDMQAVNLTLTAEEMHSLYSIFPRFHLHVADAPALFSGLGLLGPVAAVLALVALLVLNVASRFVRRGVAARIR